MKCSPYVKILIPDFSIEAAKIPWNKNGEAVGVYLMIALQLADP
jgi:hypothetical protein